MAEIWNKYAFTAARKHGTRGRERRPKSTTIDAHTHVAVPRAGHQRPLRREIPRALQVLVDIIDNVILVTTQRALHAENVANEIVVAPTQLVLPIIGSTHDPGHRLIGQQPVPGPTRIGAAEVTIQVDHTAGAPGRGLCACRGGPQPRRLKREPVELRLDADDRRR